MRLVERKILVTGGSGALGSELIPLLIDEGAEVDAPTRAELRVEDVVEVAEFARNTKYDLVIHAAAWTDVPKAENPKFQRKVIESNIFGAANIAYAFDEVSKVKVVYISTDYVYPGIEGNYTPRSKTGPTTFYGFTKLAGESHFSKTDLIIRTSFAKRGTWGTEKNQLTKAFKDVYTSKDWVDVIAKKIIEVICKGKKGVINIGTKRKTVLDLAVEDFPEVSDLSYRDIDLPYDYPVDCSMKSSI